MTEIDASRPRSVGDDLRLGLPVLDRFGMLWWPANSSTQWLVCALSAEAGSRQTPVPIQEVRSACGPLRRATAWVTTGE